MASGAINAIGGSNCGSQLKHHESRRMNFRVCCVSSSSSYVNTGDPYRTLRIQPGASESEVRKAFRQLALQYHPDVCKGAIVE